MKYIFLFALVLCISACQSTNKDGGSNQSVALPSEASWRGYKTNRQDCIRFVVELQSLKAAGYTPGAPSNRDELDQLFRYMNASELLRLRKDCWSAPPPDQPGIDWKTLTRSGTLAAASAPLPATVNKTDKMAVDLYRDMLLHGYSQNEATSLVGKALWNELLQLRHWYVENRFKL